MDKQKLEQQIKKLIAKIDQIAQRFHSANYQLRAHPESGIEDLRQEEAQYRQELQRVLEKRSNMP